MSNTITAYFKGRVGVAESVYQNDYGIVMAFDSIDLPAHFDCYFSRLNQEEALPGLGADNRVTIPNSILANPGNVTIHIPLHTGESDSEVEYVIYFKVIGRARPEDDGTPTQMTAIEQALALLQQPIGNIEQIVNEALAFTGVTFSEIEEDFAVLKSQFDTAVAALTVDSEIADTRVGDDGSTYTSAGNAVRSQVSSLKSEAELLRSKAKIQLGFPKEQGSIDDSGADVERDTHERTDGYIPSVYPLYVDTTLATDTVLIRAYDNSKTFLRSYSQATGAEKKVYFASDVAYFRVAVKDGFSTIKLYKNNDSKIVTSEWATPEMFGAVGDGLVDDADAIQAAVDYAISNSINFRCGNNSYAITKQINIDVTVDNGYNEQTPLTFDFNNARIKANSDLAFDSSFTSVHFTSNKGFMIRVSNPHNHHQVEVRNLNLWCENRANGVLMIDCHRADLHNCFVHYPHGNGVWCCYDEESDSDMTFGQTLISGVRVVGYVLSTDTFARDICALYASVSDIVIENFFYQNCLKGLFVGGGQIRLHNVHGYTSVQSYIGSYALRAGNQSKIIAVDLYADSTNYAVYAAKNADVQVIGLEYLGNESGDLVDLLDEHPLEIVKYYGSAAQTGHINISNAILTIPTSTNRMVAGSGWFGNGNICSTIVTTATQEEIDAFVETVPGALVEA